MVLTRSMTAKFYDPNYSIEYTPNTYNPNIRIALVNEQNIKNRNISLRDMYDIYNDIRYKSNQNSGIIADEDLIPLLYSIMGIYYEKINNTIIKISKCIKQKKWSLEKELLRNIVLHKIKYTEIAFRQTGVNCGFGDFNTDNGVILALPLKIRSSIYTQRLTPYNIKHMNIFSLIKTMIDEYISILKNAVKDFNNLETLFTEELCINNFSKGSIYYNINEIANYYLNQLR